MDTHLTNSLITQFTIVSEVTNKPYAHGAIIKDYRRNNYWLKTHLVLSMTAGASDTKLTVVITVPLGRIQLSENFPAASPKWALWIASECKGRGCVLAVVCIQASTWSKSSQQCHREEHTENSILSRQHHRHYKNWTFCWLKDPVTLTSKWPGLNYNGNATTKKRFSLNKQYDRNWQS